MSNIFFRNARHSDANTYFQWVNDPEVRNNSFNSNLIDWESHIKWFEEKLKDENYVFYIFQNDKLDNIGQIRIQRIDDVNALISISICKRFRGFGYGQKMLVEACKNFFCIKTQTIINAYIKSENISSKIIFEKAGFKLLNNLIHENFKTDHYKLCK
jgi:RimJ/RimL family protein N-acetyltransferase